MRHYKIVKKGTIFTIALATLAVFLQLGLAVYTKYSVVPTKQARAEDVAPVTCANPPATTSASIVGNVLYIEIINQLPDVGFKYEIGIYDTNDNIIQTSSGEVARGVFPQQWRVTFPTGAIPTATFKVIVKYTDDRYMSSMRAPCYTQTVQIISATGETPPDFDLKIVGSDTVELKDAEGKPIGSPVPVTLNYSFAADKPNQSFNLLITDCAGEPHTKESGVIKNSNNGLSFIPEEKTCGQHTVTLTISTAGVALAEKSVTINVNGYELPEGASDPTAGVLKPGGLNISSVGYKLLGTEIKLSKIDSGLGDVVNIIINGLIYIIGILSLAGIVYGGILYITAGGDDAKAEKGKKTLIYSIIGIILAVLSLTIVAIIVKFPNIT